MTCDTLFLHDANATRLSKWTAVRVTPTEGYSAKLKSRELKLRQPPYLRNSGYAHTIYIDANVGAPRSGRAARAVQQLALHVQRWAHDRVGNTVAEEQSVCEQEPDRDAGADVPEASTGEGVVRQGDCAQVRLAIAFVLRRRVVGGDPTAGRSAARPSSHQPRAARMRADDSGSAGETGGNHRSVPRSAFSALLREPWTELASQKREGAEGDAAHSAPLTRLVGAPLDAARRSLRRSGRARGGSPRPRPH